MPKNRTSIALAIGTTVATIALTAGSLFTMNAMAHGNMQDSGKAQPAGKGINEAGIKRGNVPAAPKQTQGSTFGERVGSGLASGSQRQAAPHTFADIDTDKDGRISRTEFAAAHDGKDAMFSKVDSNGDGFISKQEFDAHHAKMMPAQDAQSTDATNHMHH